MTQLRKFCRIFAMAILAFVLPTAVTALAAGDEKAITEPTAKPQVTGSPVACNVSMPVVPQARREGLTELVGDIVINCTGGPQVTSAGRQIPTTANISLTFQSNPSTALLTIGDPGAIKAPDGSETRGVVDGNAIIYSGVPLSKIWTLSGISFTPQFTPQGAPFPVTIGFGGQVLGGQPIQFTPSNLLLPLAATTGQGGDKTTTITITDPNAQVLIFANKVKPTAVAVPPSAQDNHEFKIDQSFYGTGPVPDGLIPYYCEPDGPYIFAAPGLPLDQLPCPKDKLKPLGVIIPVGGSATISKLADGTFTVTITRGPGGAVTPPAPAPAAPVAGAAAESHPFGIGAEFGPKIGATVYSGANTCSSLLAASSCHAGDTSPLFGAYGGVTFGGYLGVFGGFNHAFDINRNGNLSGATEHSSAQTQSETITGRLSFPVAGVLPYVDAGVAFTQNHLGENETLGSGSASTSLHTSFNINTTTYVVGGGVQVRLCNHLSIGVFTQYTPVQKGALLNEHNISAGVIIPFSVGKYIAEKYHGTKK
jgi:opacity protein-like surface antigen